MQLLQEWARQSALPLRDPHDLQLVDDVDGTMMDSLQPNKTVMSDCLTVPGALHLLHNICSELHSHLQSFKKFWEQLKVTDIDPEANLLGWKCQIYFHGRGDF